MGVTSTVQKSPFYQVTLVSFKQKVWAKVYSVEHIKQCAYEI